MTRRFQLSSGPSLGFGARIGAGFAAVLVVVILGYSVGLSTTSAFSDTVELLHRSEAASRASLRVSAALDSFENRRDEVSASAVDGQLALLARALDNLTEFARETERDPRNLLAAKQAAEYYHEHFSRLQILEWSRQDTLADMGALIAALERQLTGMGRRADEAFQRARHDVERVDAARNASAAAADTANAAMVALSSLRLLERQLSKPTGGDVEGATRLLGNRFDQLFAAIPMLHANLPEQQRLLRKFERWLRAYQSALLQQIGSPSERAASTHKAAAVLLQTEANTLYRAAVKRSARLQQEARAVRARVNRASDSLGLVNIVQIETALLGSGRRALLAQSSSAVEELWLVLDRLAMRIESSLGEAGEVDDDWRAVLDFLANVRRDVRDLSDENATYQQASRDMHEARLALEQLIAGVSQAERAKVDAYPARAQQVMLTTTIGALLLAIGLASGITRLLSRELSALSDSMRGLAAGDSGINIPYLTRQDQTGNMARALDVFRSNARALEHHQQHLETLVQERTVEMEAACQKAERLAKVKSEFLANMSHEIRTPLNAMLGLAQIGVRDHRDQRTSKTFAQILESGHHLLGVINAILDFSKIEAGKLGVESRPFDLRRTIDDTVAMISVSAEAKGIALAVEIAETLPDWASGDSLRLRQILINLLNNAIKFTDAGRVTLSVNCHAEQVFFEISDTGVGISAEQLSRLFQPFEQADGSTTRTFGGTGLGLAISDNLARLMGGDIEVSSRLGVGSVFSLRLPLPVAEPEPVDEVQPAHDGGARLRGVRILAADDVELNRFILTELLAPEGAVLTLAAHGQQAVQAVVDAGPQGFDLVLMDVQMPVMDGHQATRELRKLAPALPVIGVTAHALAEERDKSLASGMCDHVTKPIDIEALVAAILRQLPKQKPAAGDVAAAEVAVLPVDDSGAFEHAQSELVDWPALHQRFNGKVTFVNKLTGLVLRDYAESAAELRQAIEAGDADSVAFLAHKLKNVGGTLHAHSLRDLSEQVEHAARAGDAELSALGSALADTLQQLLTELAHRQPLAASPVLRATGGGQI